MQNIQADAMHPKAVKQVLAQLSQFDAPESCDAPKVKHAETLPSSCDATKHIQARFGTTRKLWAVGIF